MKKIAFVAILLASTPLMAQTITPPAPMTLYGPGSGSGIAATGTGWACNASGAVNGDGSAQWCNATLRGQTAGSTAVRLTADQAAAGSANCINLPTNTAISAMVTITAFDRSVTTKSSGWIAWPVFMVRGSSAAATTVGSGTKPTPIQNGTVTGTDISVAADTTNGCLNLSWTPPTANTDLWDISASVTWQQVH